MSNLPPQLTQREIILCKLQHVWRQLCSRMKGMWYLYLEIFNRQVKQRRGGGGQIGREWHKGMERFSSAGLQTWEGNRWEWRKHGVGVSAPELQASLGVLVQGFQAPLVCVSSVFVCILNWDCKPQWLVQCAGKCIDLGSEKKSAGLGSWVSE